MCDLFVKYFPIIKDTLITFVAVGGFFIALFGLKTWRKELKGKAEYDLARRILKAVYKIRNSIRNVRNPTMSGAEIPKSKEATKEAEIRGFIQAYQQRSVSLYEALADLDVAVLEAEELSGGNK